MCVVGFDLGNENCAVVVARQQCGIDVVLNDESKCETPAVVCFDEKQRFIGTLGAVQSMMNPKNSVSQIKRLIGRKFSDPELQRDLQSLPYLVTEGPDGFPLIHVKYLGEQRTFTPTQVLGMVLSHLKGIAKKNYKELVAFCCIGIPMYFNELQRRAVLDAVSVAGGGLITMQLIHETTATALAYGIYKTDLSENDQLNVAFVDVGHASMQVCIAGFKKGQLTILSQAYDRSLGGRDFDDALFKHFAHEFRYRYKIDVYQSVRASLRLRVACEKLKKTLSAYTEGILNIEWLMDGKDVKVFIKREEFEQISMPILERVKAPLEKALLDAGLTVQNIHSVEVVGSGSRVPAIIRILAEFFSKEPRHTMNASECVARGCALQCGILTLKFKVREFLVYEDLPFSIAMSWKGAAPDAQNGAPDQQQTIIVFPKGNKISDAKDLTFFRSSTFSVDFLYTDVADQQIPAKISTYTIGPFQPTKGEPAKLRVTVVLTDGVVSVDSATMLEEEEVEIPVSATKKPLKEYTKMDVDESSIGETDVSMQDFKPQADSSGVGSENGATDSADKPVQMDTDAKVEVHKRKAKEINVSVSEIVHGGMTYLELLKAEHEESKMASLDRALEKSKY
ncbi:heat shock 70 kDa protein 14-like [Dioscorea cayenensis subsp. rotundata]|uniref:Heat shock 70 kDa protein 14-like n=1 Tax=Dioscorea cayennensis subsp. rotundata TaxID=55577 RepID=A0AB40CU60_DIOCR|nr:heat shock 70 kDa protein 14-like [Dioscorea cayenensis subsp. rotundata]